MEAQLVLLPGDGIGPEVCAEAERVLKVVAGKFGHRFQTRRLPMGGNAIDIHGDPLPAETLEACRTADAILLGAVGGPKWDDPQAKTRPEAGLLRLRKELGLFANLRPIAPSPHLLDASPLKPSIIGGTDILFVRELTGGRCADYVFDTVGSPSTVADAVAAARKGGTIVVTGLARIDGVASLATFPFVMQEKRLIGSVYGSGQPSQDIPKLARLYQEGKLKLRELVTRSYALREINDALTALERADGARGVISW